MHRRSVKDCSAVVTARPWRSTVPTERNNPAMELGSLKFRVSREEFADSVAWVARSLPSRPPVPVLGGVLLDATEQGLTVSGFDYEVSAQVRVAAEVGSCRSGPRLRQAARRHHEVASQQAGRRDPRRHPRPDHLRKRQVLAAHDAGRGLSPASAAAAADRLDSRSTCSPKRSARWPSRQARTTPSRCSPVSGSRSSATRSSSPPPTGSVSRSVNSSGRRRTPTSTAAVLIPAKTLSESAKTLAGDATSPVELALGSGSAVGNDGLLGIVNDGRRTTTRLLDAEFPKFRQLLPSEHTAHGHRRDRSARRGHQACGPRRRAWCAGPPAVLHRGASPLRRWRRRGPRRGRL